MNELARRLLRDSRPAARALVVLGVLAVATAALVLVQAVLLADVLARGFADGAFSWAVLGALLAVFAGRALALAGSTLAGRLAAVAVMGDLRRRLAARLLAGGLGARERSGELTTAAVAGVDALEAWFTGYLPQVLLSALVPPAVLVLVAWHDLTAALVLAITVPVLIAFMILIGLSARARTRRRWRALAVLGAHFADVVRGLPTLRAHVREDAQRVTMDGVADRYRRETMGTLRVAFLSAFVLELAAMLGTALVAATVGLQLVAGDLTLRDGLIVLLLAPELYAPLRAVGQQFHASEDGLAAAERIYSVLDTPTGIRTGTRQAPSPATAPIRLRGIAFSYPIADAAPPAPAAAAPAASTVARRPAAPTDPAAVPTTPHGPAAPTAAPTTSHRPAAPTAPTAAPTTARRPAAPTAPTATPTTPHDPAAPTDSACRAVAVLRDVSLTLRPGETVALTGESGAGKSTLAALLLRLADPDAGTITCGSDDLRDVDLASWREQIAWIPQRPAILTGSVADNIRLGAPGASLDAVRRAATAARADTLIAGLPDGYDTVIGDGGRALSAGEAQRVALARAFLRDAPLVILDEPTAHLDPATAADVEAAVIDLCRDRTALLIAHRPQLAALADRTLTLRDGALHEARPAATAPPAAAAPRAAAPRTAAAAPRAAAPRTATAAPHATAPRTAAAPARAAAAPRATEVGR